MDTSSSTATSGASDALGAVLDFTQDDVLKNRAGLLSTRQRQRLIQAFQRDMLFIGGGLLLISIIALRPHEWLLVGKAPDDRTIVSIVLIGVLWATVLVTIGFAFYRFWQDVGAGRVAHASGAIQLLTRKTTTRWRSGALRTIYLVQVDGEQLKVPLSVYTLLQDGAAYTLYYTLYTKKVLSISS